ncbi:MAG: L,D-transpeptidase, partial [Coriobacteriia bacterium]|nr:L,D-transpeptidase [Coriobacteriia bacterium]
TFNQYVPFKITYIFGDNREVLDGYTTINWVNTEGDAPYELNFEAVAAWVAELAARYNTLEGPRGIVNGFGEQKHVEGGTFGWMLDQESECWAIMNASAHRLGEEREAHWLTHGITFGDNDWGGTYLQVDMTRQYMWYYVDGVCVLETDVITGNPNTGYATPQGVWYIYNKSMYVTARGDLLPNGTYRWETPLTYWMPFTPSGCGFHDAYWQPSFGGQHYLYRGSHGCINMPPHLAAELYEMLEPGTPVITHF